MDRRAREVLFGILQRQISAWVFRDEVAMGNVVVVDGLAEFFGAIGVAGTFEVFFDFAFEAFGIVFVAKFARGIVAIFLEAIKLAIETAESVDGGSKLFGVSSELFRGVLLEEDLRELRGSELKAYFGELGGVGGAEMFDEVVLEETGFHSTVLLVAPFAIAAAGLPVGNVALGGGDTVFGERLRDFGMGNVIAEHAIDHVADLIGEAGDFAVATDFAVGSGWVIGFVD